MLTEVFEVKPEGTLDAPVRTEALLAVSSLLAAWRGFGGP